MFIDELVDELVCQIDTAGSQELWNCNGFSDNEDRAIIGLAPYDDDDAMAMILRYGSTANYIEFIGFDYNSDPRENFSIREEVTTTDARGGWLEDDGEAFCFFAGSDGLYMVELDADDGDINQEYYLQVPDVSNYRFVSVQDIDG